MNLAQLARVILLDKQPLALSYLKSNIGWLIFSYPDDSKRYIRTTLNEEILQSVENTRQPNCLYDLDKHRWVTLPTNQEVKLEVSDTRPEIGVLMEYVNKFI